MRSAIRSLPATATRRSGPASHPVALPAVVSGAALRRQTVTTLKDRPARLPNVRIAADPGSGPDVGRSVATVLDGVYRSRSRSTRAALVDPPRTVGLPLTVRR